MSIQTTNHEFGIYDPASEIELPDFDLPDLFELDETADSEQPSTQNNHHPAAVVANVAQQPNGGPRVKAGDCLYVDIETVPDRERVHLFGLPPLVTEVEVSPAVKLPAIAAVSKTIAEAKTLLTGLQPSEAWLDEWEQAERSRPDGGRSGIYGLINEKRKPFTDVLTAAADRVKLLSVTPLFCRICVIGKAVGEGEPETRVCRNAAEEREALQWWWTGALMNRPWVGFNIRDFDLQVLLLRSTILGVYPPIIPDRRRYGSRDVLDLMTELHGDRCPKGFGLKPTCRMLGLIPPLADGDDGMDGSKVYDLYEAGLYGQIAAYCADDVRLAQQLHRRVLSGFFTI